MNSDQMAGKWKQAKGAVKQRWAKLTDDDLEMIRGQHDILIGKLQERYGIAREEAMKQADQFLKSANFDDFPSQGQPAGHHPEPAHQGGKR